MDETRPSNERNTTEGQAYNTGQDGNARLTQNTDSSNQELSSSTATPYPTQPQPSCAPVDAPAYPPQGAPYPSQPQPYPSQPQPYPPPGTTPYPPQVAPYPPTDVNPAYPPPPYPGPPTNAAAYYPPPAGEPISGDDKKYNPGTNAVGWQPTQQQPTPPPANVTIVRTNQLDVGTEPESYMVCSIISVCFCLVFGIVAIIYSAQVSSLWAAGRAAEARRASATARGWAIAAFVVGCIVVLFNVIRSFAFY